MRPKSSPIPTHCAGSGIRQTGRGQTIYLFATGDGLFHDTRCDDGFGACGRNVIDVTSENVMVTVGGIAGTTVFAGVPPWSIGVTQVNFTIPPDAPLGVQPVVMSVGSASSAPVFITVTQ